MYVNAPTFDVLSLKYRYPQGSVLGLLPFSIDINDLNLFIKACCELFADDTTILSSMSRCHYKRANSSLLEWAEFYQMSLIFIRPNLSLSQPGKETKFKFKLSTYFHPSPNCKWSRLPQSSTLAFGCSFSWISHVTALRKGTWNYNFQSVLSIEERLNYNRELWCTKLCPVKSCPLLRLNVP